MKKVLVPILIGLVSFAAGAFGLFFAMPSIAPERVNEALTHLDSLMRADSLANLDLPASDSLLADTDSAASEIVQPDASDSTLWVSSGDASPGDSLGDPARHAGRLAAENEALKARIQELESEEQTAPAPPMEAATLSGTLTKLEDEELRAVVQQLDPNVLKLLYVSASGRNQARLLQAMPPDRAANFLQNMVLGSGTPLANSAGATNTATEKTALD